MPTNILDFGEGTLVFGASEFICQVMSCVVVPSNTRNDIVTACGTTTRFVNEQFEMRLSYVQDWHTGGISQYLWANYNTDKTFTFSPADDNTPALAGTLTVPRPAMGGAAGQPLLDDVVAPLVGTPTLTVDAA